MKSHNATDSSAHCNEWGNSHTSSQQTIETYIENWAAREASDHKNEKKKK